MKKLDLPGVTSKEQAERLARRHFDELVKYRPVAPNNFKVGDRVINGSARATVVELVADDFLRVVYDYDMWKGDPTTELAAYFRHED